MGTDTEDLTAEELKYLETGGAEGLDDPNPAAGEGQSDGTQGGPDGGEGGSGDDSQAGAEGADKGQGQDQGDGEQGKAKGGEGDGRPKFVPFDNFHAINEKYKSTRDELQTLKGQLEEQRSTAQKLLETVQQRAGQKQDGEGTQELSIDDIKKMAREDIFGAFEKLLDQTTAIQGKFSEIEKTSKEAGERTQADLAEMNMKTAYRDDAVRFAGKEPEFASAYKYLMQGRAKELQAIGFGDGDEQKIMGQIAKEEKSIVAAALEKGKSPAEALFEIAKARGFAPPAKQQQQQSNGQGQQGQSQKSDAEKKLEGVEKGQQAFKSLSTSGSGGGEGLTIEGLAAMSEDEFLRLVSDPKIAAQVEALMGGA